MNTITEVNAFRNLSYTEFDAREVELTTLVYTLLFPGRTTDHARYNDLPGWTAANVNARRLATGRDGWKVLAWLGKDYDAATTPAPEPSPCCPTCHDCGEGCPDCTPFAAAEIDPKAVAMTEAETVAVGLASWIPALNGVGFVRGLTVSERETIGEAMTAVTFGEVTPYSVATINRRRAAGLAALAAVLAARPVPTDPTPAPVNATGETGTPRRRRTTPRPTFTPHRDWTPYAEPCEVRGAWSGHPAECV